MRSVKVKINGEIVRADFYWPDFFLPVWTFHWSFPNLFCIIFIPPCTHLSLKWKIASLLTKNPITPQGIACTGSFSKVCRSVCNARLGLWSSIHRFMSPVDLFIFSLYSSFSFSYFKSGAHCRRWRSLESRLSQQVERKLIYDLSRRLSGCRHSFKAQWRQQLCLSRTSEWGLHRRETFIQ